MGLRELIRLNYYAEVRKAQTHISR